jgi:hypothetical protein
VLNCVVLWNTVYMNAALNQLRANGNAVLDEDIVPFVRRHLGVHGDYSFLLPELAGTLRELRDPTAMMAQRRIEPPERQSFAPPCGRESATPDFCHRSGAGVRHRDSATPACVHERCHEQSV